MKCGAHNKKASTSDLFLFLAASKKNSLADVFVLLTFNNKFLSFLVFNSFIR